LTSTTAECGAVSGITRVSAKPAARVLAVHSAGVPGTARGLDDRVQTPDDATRILRSFLTTHHVAHNKHKTLAGKAPALLDQLFVNAEVPSCERAPWSRRRRKSAEDVAGTERKSLGEAARTRAFLEHRLSRRHVESAEPDAGGAGRARPRCRAEAVAPQATCRTSGRKYAGGEPGMRLSVRPLQRSGRRPDAPDAAAVPPTRCRGDGTPPRAHAPLRASAGRTARAAHRVWQRG
jgi:hypothetical protein